MANNNQIELVVTVEVDKANQSIKSVNANLSGIEAAATQVGARRLAWHRRHDGLDGQGRDGWQPARGRDQEGHRVRRRSGPSRRRRRRRTRSAPPLSRARWPRRTATVLLPRRRQSRRSGRSAMPLPTPPTSRPEAHHRGYRSGQGPEPRQDRQGRRRRNTEGIGAADAFEKIMLAIETGQSRGLRTHEPLSGPRQGRTGRHASGATARQDALRTGGQAGPVQRHRGGRDRRSRGPRRRRLARSTAR